MLGKIKNCYFGIGGYQDAMVGFTFALSTKEGDCVDFWGYWSYQLDDEDLSKNIKKELFGDAVIKVSNILSDAKKKLLNELIGVPVEIEFDRGRLVSWRILTEVL